MIVSQKVGPAEYSTLRKKSNKNVKLEKAILCIIIRYFRGHAHSFSQGLNKNHTGAKIYEYNSDYYHTYGTAMLRQHHLRRSSVSKNQVSATLTCTTKQQMIVSARLRLRAWHFVWLVE